MREKVQRHQSLSPHPDIIHMWINSRASVRAVVKVTELYWSEVFQLLSFILHSFDKPFTEWRESIEQPQFDLLPLEVHFRSIIL